MVQARLLIVTASLGLCAFVMLECIWSVTGDLTVSVMLTALAAATLAPWFTGVDRGARPRARR